MTVNCPKCSTENTRDSRFCKTCADALTGTPDTGVTLTQTLTRPIQELSPGALFAGRYQIIEDLGQGGMGHVFKALDTRTGEKIAVKVLRSGLEADGRTLERFSHELTAARRISHRNVCRMFDLGEDGGRLYITMEFVPGRGPQEHPPDDGGDEPGPGRGPGRPDLRRARRGPPPGRRPPGPQAGQHPGRQGRPRPDHGFRHRPERPLAGDHRHGDHGRDAGLHVPGADRRPGRGRPLGPLLDGRHALRDGRRAACPSRATRRWPWPQAQDRAAARSEVGRPRACPEISPRSS